MSKTSGKFDMQKNTSMKKMMEQSWKKLSTIVFLYVVLDHVLVGFVVAKAVQSQIYRKNLDWAFHFTLKQLSS